MTGCISGYESIFARNLTKQFTPVGRTEPGRSEFKD